MAVRALVLCCLLSVSSSTPYYDFLFRLEEFKARALEDSRCDWWRDVLKLHFRHETFCEEGLVDKIHDLDDFEMAGLSWIVTHEWRNPLLSEHVKVPTALRARQGPSSQQQRRVVRATLEITNHGSRHLTRIHCTSL